MMIDDMWSDETHTNQFMYVTGIIHVICTIINKTIIIQFDYKLMNKGCINYIGWWTSYKSEKWIYLRYSNPTRSHLGSIIFYMIHKSETNSIQN